MDFAAIFANHRRQALERIAAREAEGTASNTIVVTAVLTDAKPVISRLLSESKATPDTIGSNPNECDLSNKDGLRSEPEFDKPNPEKYNPVDTPLISIACSEPQQPLEEQHNAQSQITPSSHNVLPLAANVHTPAEAILPTKDRSSVLKSIAAHNPIQLPAEVTLPPKNYQTSSKLIAAHNKNAAPQPSSKSSAPQSRHALGVIDSNLVPVIKPNLNPHVSLTTAQMVADIAKKPAASSMISSTKNANMETIKSVNATKALGETSHDVSFTFGADHNHQFIPPIVSTMKVSRLPLENKAIFSEQSDEELNELLRYVSVKHGKDSQTWDLNNADVHLVEHGNAPLFSSAVKSFLHTSTSSVKVAAEVYRQYGLLGVYVSTGIEEEEQPPFTIPPKPLKDRLVFANMNAPWSAFICGSQGAGKSHPLSCLLENGLLAKPVFNKLPDPLSAIVFHYDKFTGKSSTQLCEAAFLCSAGIPVNVLVSPSNIWTMKEMYHNLPDLPSSCPKPNVLPLYLSDKHLTTATMMKLMCADSKTTSAPLYIAVVHSILQEMAMQGKGCGSFSYNEFELRVDKHQWLFGQKAPLEMRLKLLESFLEPSERTRTTRPAPAKENIWEFKPGSLTIVDLSDSFVDDGAACALFSICLAIFMETRSSAGQIIALDEAHKFLTQAGEAQALTEDLTSIIRQQRHTGSRVIIATQEPTLSPKLMDLANVTIVHRFLSPAWYEVIKRHLAGADRYDGRKGNSLFDIIVALETGEALLFCPTALLALEGGSRIPTTVSKLGNDYARIQIRKRFTADGGRSILASDTATTHAVTAPVDVPMYVVTRPPTPPRQYNNFRLSRGGYQSRGQAGHGHTSPVSTSAPNTPLAPKSAPFQPIASTMVSQSATNGIKVQTVASQPSVAQVRALVRTFIKLKFQNGWTHPDGVSWRVLFQKVEETFEMKTNTVANSTLFNNACRDAAALQLNECRKEKGRAEIAGKVERLKPRG